MKIRTFLTASAIATSLALASTGQADTLKISVSKQSPEMQSISRPHNGMDKASVERVFGAPQATNGPVGEPPISNWVYEQFTVYFEGDTVLHSVLRKTAPIEVEQEAPAPAPE